MKQYRLNLQRAFDRLVKVLPPSCLLVWNMALPLGHRVSGGFLVPEVGVGLRAGLRLPTLLRSGAQSWTSAVQPGGGQMVSMSCCREP